MTKLSHPSSTSVRVIATALALTGAAACGPKVPTPVVTGADGTPVDRPPEPKKEDEELAEALARDAAALAASGDAAGARAKEDQILGTYPGTLAAARIFQARGEAAEAAGDIEGAIASYEKLLFFRPSYDGAATVRERYANLLVEVGRHADAATMLQALFRSAGATEKLRLGMPLADALTGVGRSADALEVLAELQGLREASAALRQEAGTRALEIIDSSLEFKAAEDLWDDMKGDERWGALRPAIAYKLAKIYYHVRDFERSEEMLRLVAERFGSSDLAPAAREFLARLEARFVVDPAAVGVILPLSGSFEQYGKRSLTAIQQAFGERSGFRLIVKDTKGEPATVAQAIEDLVLEDHVIAIIGPLFSTEALSAAQKAEELSVPLLTLSFREGLPQIGPFVFRTALTVEAQAKELARVAFEELGFSRFALLYPRTLYGQEFTKVFWDEVDRRKGEVRGAEMYDPSQTTFTEPVKRLVGRYGGYLNARQDFKDAVAELRARKLPPHRLQAETERLLKRLPPVVDFDAVVIPDSAVNLSLIAPALAVEDIVTTRDPKELEKIKKATSNPDVRPVTLLGGSTWNRQQTVDNCERYCEGAVFVDAFFPDSPDPKVRDFIATFREASGATPHQLEAQAYDTAGLLRSVLAQKRPTDRARLRDELARVPPYEGVTGRVYFDANGEAKQELFILTVQEGAIRRWERVAEAPQG